MLSLTLLSKYKIQLGACAVPFLLITYVYINKQLDELLLLINFIGY